MDALPLVSEEAHIRQTALFWERSLRKLRVAGDDTDQGDNNDDDNNNKQDGDPEQGNAGVAVGDHDDDDDDDDNDKPKAAAERQSLLVAESGSTRSTSTATRRESALVQSLYEKKEAPSLQEILAEDVSLPKDDKKTHGARDAPAAIADALVPMPPEDWGKAFRLGERHAIRLVLEEVDRVADEKMKTGFHESNFTMGVMNALFLAFVFGAYPQHFWLLYLVEALFFIPMKYSILRDAKPLSGVLYFLDYCWVMNITGMVMAIALLVDSFFTVEIVSNTARMQIFLAVLGTTTGPLLFATLILPFVAVVFHDLSTMAGLFIHLIPPLVGFTLRWYWGEIREAYPNVFALDYMSQITFFPGPDDSLFLGRSVLGNTMTLYWAWFIPYVVWQTIFGLRLPRSRPARNARPPKYDTAFHSTQRGFSCHVMGKVLWKRPKHRSQQQVETNDFEYRDFAAYMILHALSIHTSIVFLGYVSFQSSQCHAFLLFLTAMLCVYRGAKRYTYYTTAMYGRTIRRQFAEIIRRENLEQRYT